MPTGTRIARRRAGLDNLPVWVRLVAAICATLLVTWSLMIYLAYAQQRDASIAQARSFAESVHQMTVATIIAMMLLDVSNKREVFLEQIRNTSDVIAEIAAASQEQSTTVGQINTMMTQLSQITQQNASSSEELAATSEEMSGQAQSLQQRIGFFKVDDGEGPPAAIAANAAPAQRPAPSRAPMLTMASAEAQATSR